MIRPARLCRIVLHVAVAVWKLRFHARRWTPVERRSEIERWSCGVFNILGTELVVTGTGIEKNGHTRLVVANHISWLDIFALLATTDVCFVAKSEVRDWPVIGRLAESLGTLFIERDRRAATREINNTVAERLASGQTVCIFPEGTTTNGDMLAPFRTALFDAAVEMGIPVWPIAIRYVDHTGQSQREAAFTGDQSLVRSLLALVGIAGMRAELTFLEPFMTRGLTRQEAAIQAEGLIAAHLDVPVRERMRMMPARHELPDAGAIDLLVR